MDVNMKKIPMATTLRIYCAERTRAMQQAACVHCVHLILAPYFSKKVRVWKNMRCKYDITSSKHIISEKKQKNN